MTIKDLMEVFPNLTSNSVIITNDSCNADLKTLIKGALCYTADNSTDSECAIEQFKDFMVQRIGFYIDDFYHDPYVIIFV